MSYNMHLIDNIETFDIDVEAIKGHTIEVFIPIIAKSSLQITDHIIIPTLAPTLTPAITLLLFFQYPSLHLDNIRLEYYLAISHYLINFLLSQPYIYQTFFSISDFFPAIMQIPFQAYVNLISSFFPILVKNSGAISSPSPTQNISLSRRRGRGNYGGQKYGQREKFHVERDRNATLNLISSRVPTSGNNDIAREETDKKQRGKKI